MRSMSIIVVLWLTFSACELRGAPEPGPRPRAINFRRSASEVERQLESVTPIGSSYAQVRAFLRRELPAHNQSDKGFIALYTKLIPGPMLTRNYNAARQRGFSPPEVGLSRVPLGDYRWPSPRWGKEWAEIGVDHVWVVFPAVPRGFFQERSTTHVGYAFDRRRKLMAIQVHWGRVGRS